MKESQLGCLEKLYYKSRSTLTRFGRLLKLLKLLKGSVELILEKEKLVMKKLLEKEKLVMKKVLDKEKLVMHKVLDKEKLVEIQNHLLFKTRRAITWVCFNSTTSFLFSSTIPIFINFT